MTSSPRMSPRRATLPPGGGGDGTGGSPGGGLVGGGGAAHARQRRMVPVSAAGRPVAASLKKSMPDVDPVEVGRKMHPRG